MHSALYTLQLMVLNFSFTITKFISDEEQCAIASQVKTREINWDGRVNYWSVSSEVYHIIWDKICMMEMIID